MMVYFALNLKIIVSSDYHHEMNGDNFLKWFNHILLLLNVNAIIIMDNAPYHSMKEDKILVSSWKKSDIIE